MATINCHDCGKPVSLSARACPGCGSRDLAGPVRTRRKVPRKIGIEGLNDRNLAVASLSLGLLGACYGFATSTGTIGAIFFTALYGLVGVTIGVPIGFAINVIRR
jgi:DNA-directed RNA polymerase subunit RPC12/RpoP